VTSSGRPQQPQVPHRCWSVKKKMAFGRARNFSKSAKFGALSLQKTAQLCR